MMEIAKARSLSEQELDEELESRTASSLRPAFPAGDAPAHRLQPDLADAQGHRPPADRADRAPARRAGAAAARRDCRRRVDERRHCTRARKAQGQGRPRRFRQDGQDHRRLRRASCPSPHLQARHPPDHQVQGARRDTTRPTSATPCASRRRVRSPRPSAGASPRSWPRPASGAGEAVVSEEAETAEAIHMAAHPGRVEARRPTAEASSPRTARGRRRATRWPPRRAAERRGGVRMIQPSSRRARGRQHRRPHHRVHPRPGPLAEDHRRRR